jgi:Ca2+-binding EF-hand superfamily protein
LKNDFERESDNYKLTKPELVQFFRCPDKECDTLLEVFDPTNLGYVDAYEFLITMCLLANATLLEKAELVFKLYDFD